MVVQKQYWNQVSVAIGDRVRGGKAAAASAKQNIHISHDNDDGNSSFENINCSTLYTILYLIVCCGPFEVDFFIWVLVS
jgi:hypothetical protein